MLGSPNTAIGRQPQTSGSEPSKIYLTAEVGQKHDQRPCTDSLRPVVVFLPNLLLIRFPDGRHADTATCCDKWQPHTGACESSGTAFRFFSACCTAISLLCWPCWLSSQHPAPRIPRRPPPSAQQLPKRLDECATKVLSSHLASGSSTLTGNTGISSLLFRSCCPRSFLPSQPPDLFMVARLVKFSTLCSHGGKLDKLRAKSGFKVCSTCF